MRIQCTSITAHHLLAVRIITVDKKGPWSCDIIATCTAFFCRDVHNTIKKGEIPLKRYDGELYSISHAMDLNRVQCAGFRRRPWPVVRGQRF